MSGSAERVQPPSRVPHRIAAGIDGRAGGEDAAALAAALAALTSADLLLITLTAEVTMLISADADKLHEAALAELEEVRARWDPDARTSATTALSMAHGLETACREQRRDLLVVGSSRHGPEGAVAISHRGRSLLHALACPLAIAPVGLAAGVPFAVRRITVGFDGSDESGRALALGAGLAEAARAQLTVCGVIDDRMPALARPYIGYGMMLEAWREAMDAEQHDLEADIRRRLTQLGIEGEAVTARGPAAEPLIELSRDSDLLIVGSRRWGAPARVILGGTGEALAHGARCPLIAVPRPH